MPRNLASQREYRGVNVFLLHAMLYESPFWLTFNQARELGGHVKKSERACPVVFWKWLDIDASDETTEKKRVPFLRYYSVFNVAQCEGISPDKIPVLDDGKRDHSPIEEAERIVSAMPKQPAIRHGGDRACYVPSADRVEMPKPETFRSAWR